MDRDARQRAVRRDRRGLCPGIQRSLCSIRIPWHPPEVPCRDGVRRAAGCCGRCCCSAARCPRCSSWTSGWTAGSSPSSPGPAPPRRPATRCAAAGPMPPRYRSGPSGPSRLGRRRPGAGSPRSGCGSPANCTTSSPTRSRWPPCRPASPPTSWTAAPTRPGRRWRTYAGRAGRRWTNYAPPSGCWAAGRTGGPGPGGRDPGLNRRPVAGPAGQRKSCEGMYGLGGRIPRRHT